MSTQVLTAVLLFLTAVGFWMGRTRGVSLRSERGARVSSQPHHYGYYVALWTGLPTLLILLTWSLFGHYLIEIMLLAALPEAEITAMSPGQLSLTLAQIKNAASGGQVFGSNALIEAGGEELLALRQTSRWLITVLLAVAAIAFLLYAYSRVRPNLRARPKVETTLQVAMIVCSIIAILTTVGIVLSLFFEALRFFARYSPLDFLFGLQWSPQTAIREDQVGSSGAFGAIPVLWGTVMIAVIAMAVATPLGLSSAIYLAEYAPRRVRSTVKPLLEVLAGIPTVVYGFFAILTVGPVLRGFGESLGIDASSNSALTAGAVMGIMLIPFISSLSDDVINAVPRSLRDGAAGLGATKSETIRSVVLPAALPGIVGAILLAVSRAIGETMIVVMAAGLAARMTLNPFSDVTTVTVQIVNNLTGDTAFDSAKTLSAFALGLLLFVVTLALNVVALGIVKKYREKYD